MQQLSPSTALDDASGPCSSPSEPARLRAHLDQMRKESRPVKWQRRFEKVAASLEEALAAYEAAIQDRRALHQRLKRQTLMLQLLEFEVRWRLQRNARPSAPDPYIPSPTGLLGFRELPLPDGWDRSWERRVLMLSSSDLAWLHCDWLQCSALLMYKAELYGPSSMEHQQLRDYAERYAVFNQHLIRLIPLEWRRRSLYNLNIMAPIAQPPDPAWLDQFLTTRCKAKPYLLQAFQEYHTQAKTLREQYTVLVGQYSHLAAAHASGQGWAAVPWVLQDAAGPGAAAVPSRADVGMRDASAAKQADAAAGASAQGGRGKAAGDAKLPSMPAAGQSHSQRPGPQATFAMPQAHPAAAGSATAARPKPTGPEQAAAAAGGAPNGSQDLLSSMDEMLRAVQANLLQQRHALQQCLFAVRFSDDIVEHIRVYLLLYPLAIDTVDFLEAAAGPPGPAGGDLMHPQ